MNAKKVGIVGRNEWSTVIEYEYRWKTYDVEYANSWLYCVTPASKQHKLAQERIDKEIEEEQKPQKPIRHEDTAEYGFELFWSFVES